MTREEIVKNLEAVKSKYSWTIWTDEALDTAIQAVNFKEVYEQTIKEVNRYYDKHHTVFMNWIPCDEELPKKGEDVLVTNNWHEVRMAYLSDRTVGKVLCWIVDHNSYHPVERHEILAWMHLPHPFFKPTPEEEGEKE